MTRYVIRVRADALRSVDKRIRGKWVTTHWEPHPDRGLYVKDGGHTTANLQEAKVFLESVRKGRAYHESIHELVPVTIAPLAGVALRAWEARQK